VAAISGERPAAKAVLRRHPAGRRFGFDVERAIYLTVVHRLMVSGSDRHAGKTLDIRGAKDPGLAKSKVWKLGSSRTCGPSRGSTQPFPDTQVGRRRQGRRLASGQR
jgi:hypothetical protein